MCTDQDNLCAPVILLNCWSQKRAMPRISKGEDYLFWADVHQDPALFSFFPKFFFFSFSSIFLSFSSTFSIFSSTKCIFRHASVSSTYPCLSFRKFVSPSHFRISNLWPLMVDQIKKLKKTKSIYFRILLLEGPSPPTKMYMKA